ncbi:hypothetical protein ACSBL2_11305 [Pedobacter sp. AW31-3R]|uniref:hypothetical protein n=1 Tax=Pedobacter sp. AW31-3R TaxID=3445781 RepID=UPI003F9FF542
MTNKSTTHRLSVLVLLVIFAIAGCKKEETISAIPASAAVSSTPQSSDVVNAILAGQLSWTLTSTNVPSAALARITTAMNDACARYNAAYNWPARTLTVEYNTGVATADGSTNGNIRFGSTASYQGVRTAMHEIAHTYGVGLSSGWTANISGGQFIGANAVATLASFDGAGAVIYTGGGHFWPYGLNYDNEWSETNAARHIQLVVAMKADGM